MENLNKFTFRPEEQSQEVPSYSSEKDINEEESTTEKNLEKKQNLSQPADKIINRHKIRYTATRIKYSPTRIKSRNFLSNISYTGINKNDFYNENFVLDVYVLLVKNLNPFSSSRKFQINWSMKWYICSGGSAFLLIFIGIYAKRRTPSIWTVEMLDNLARSKL